MAKTKKKAPQLLALFMATMLVLSSFGSVAAVAAVATGEGTDTDCDIVSYTPTSSLTEDDKSDSIQANTQTSTLTTSDGTGATYSTSLLQSAEWTNKTTGEAALNIHYEADFDTNTTATRSLYVFTPCNVHSFSEQIAIENIVGLLNYNEYVDVIVIGTANSKSGTTTWDVTVASMFSLKASDFADYEDGLESDKFNSSGNYIGTAANTKAAMIAKVLETYLNSTEECTKTSACDSGANCTENNFANISYAYGLGLEGAGTGKVEMLYDKSNNVTYPTTYYGSSTTTFATAAELALSFGGRRHSGAYFSLYYIAQYIDIIEDENNYGSGSFSSTVRAIFNSNDAFATACHCGSTDNYSTDTLYDAIKEYIGLDMTSASMSLSDIYTAGQNGNTYASACWEALSVLKTYSSEGRYVALIPDETTSRIYNFNDGYYTSNVITTEQRQNMLLFALTIMAPSIVEDESEARSTISNWLDTKTTVTIEGNFQTYNENIYGYSKNLSELDILQSVYTTNSVTITTTITSEFEITDTSTITVVNSGDASSYFYYGDPVITPNSDGTTTVSIDFYNFSEDDTWAIDISIPASLKDNTEFRTSEDWFRDTNVGVTTAEVTAVTTTSTAGSEQTETVTATETVTVASPKLYKAPGSLKISKTVSGDATEAQKNASYSFTVILTDSSGSALSGAYAAVYSDESVSDTSVTFDEDGKATVSLTGGQSVTISGLPTGASYTVTEDTSNITGAYEVWVNGNETATATGTIEEGKTAETAFNNQFKAGSLVVSKTISGDDTLTDADKETQFSFKVTASLNGSPLVGTYGDMTFNNGVAEFTLTHGQSKTATNLPSGTSYTVEELNVDSDAWTTNITVGNDVYINATEASGTIVDNGTTTVAFNNSKNATTGNLIISKTVSGTDADESKEFTFAVDLGNSSITKVYSATRSDGTTTSDEQVSFTSGVAEIKLKHGESLTILDLDVDTSYTVVEADYSNEGYETTANNVSDSRIASGTITAGATSTASFQNHKDLDPNLKIEKTTTDGSTSANAGDTVEYTLTITQTVEHAVAKNIVVEDELPTGLSYVDDVATSAVVKIGDSVVENATVEASGQTLTVTDIKELSYGESLTITYSVTVDGGTEGSRLTNTATVTSDEIPDGPDDTWTVDVPEDAEEDLAGDPEEGTDGGDSDSDDDDDNTTDDGNDFSDDATVDDDDTSTSDILPQTGDSTGALLPIIALVALGAFAVAVLAAFALRRRRIH